MGREADDISILYSAPSMVIRRIGYVSRYVSRLRVGVAKKRVDTRRWGCFPDEERFDAHVEGQKKQSCTTL